MERIQEYIDTIIELQDEGFYHTAEGYGRTLIEMEAVQEVRLFLHPDQPIEYRRVAAWLLGCMEDVSVLPDLQEAAQDEDEILQCLALESVKMLTPPEKLWKQLPLF